jgi:hypothetical protein
MVVSESSSKVEELWSENFVLYSNGISGLPTTCNEANDSFDSQDAQGRFEEFSTIVWNDCRDKKDGCSSLEFNFRKTSKYDGAKGETCDAKETKPVKSKYVYIWFPHGYMHIWSIDIYYQPTLGQFCADGLIEGYGDSGHITYEHCDLHKVATVMSRGEDLTRSRFRYGVKRGDGSSTSYDIDWPSTEKRSLFVTENGEPKEFKLEGASDSGQSQLIFHERPAKGSLIEWSTVQPGACYVDVRELKTGDCPSDNKSGACVVPNCSHHTTSKDCQNPTSTKGACVWVD